MIMFMEKKILDKPRIIELPKFLDDRGNLSFIEENNHIPFKIARTHWIYDVPGGTERGGHAYQTNCEFVVALSGSFDVIINNGIGDEIFHLNRSYYGLYIPNLYWRTMSNFSTNSFALVLSSKEYIKDDYIFDYDTFLKNIQ